MSTMFTRIGAACLAIAGLAACSNAKEGAKTVFVQAQGRTDAEGPAGMLVTIAAVVQNGTSTQVDVAWGDGQNGTFSQNVAISHTYTTAGSRTITITSNGETTEVNTTLTVVDADSDFYISTGAGSIRGTDCNDSNSAVNPAAAEIAGDGQDSDCDGAEAT